MGSWSYRIILEDTAGVPASYLVDESPIRVDNVIFATDADAFSDFIAMVEWDGDFNH